MAYQPTFPSPYMETIDATQEGGNVFKCLINPKDTVLDASINIFNNNNLGKKQLYSGTVTLSSIPSTISYITITGVDAFCDLKQRINRNENLSVNIIWNATSTARTVNRISYNGSATFVYFTNVVSIGSNNAPSYTWNINTNVGNSVAFAESVFPFKGGLSDESWLTCLVENNTLNNGEDYKWNINLKTNENITIKTLLGLTPTRVSSSTNINLKNNVYCSMDVATYESCVYACNQGECYITINSETRKIKSLNYPGANATVDNAKIYNISTIVLEEPLTEAYAENSSFIITQSFCELSSPEYYFKARTNPVVTFDVPEIINSSSHTFSATYSQDQKVGVVYFQYDLLKNGIEIASSGKVFTQNITHTFDNLVNDTSYNILLTIVNNDGIEIHEERTFKAEYPIMASTVMPVLSLDNNIGRISVDFDNNASIPSTLIGTDEVEYKIFGVANETPNYTIVSSGKILEGSSDSRVYIEHYANIEMGMYIKIGEETIKIRNYRHQDDNSVLLVLLSTPQEEDLVGLPYEILSYFNGIHLEENESILWDTISDNPLVLPDNSSQVVHWHGTHGFNGVILEKINSDSPLGSTVVSYDGMNFSYKLGTEDVVNFCPYTGFANAIAGRDEHSTTDIVLGYDPSSLTVTVSETALATVGNCIQINKECRTITSVVVDGNFSIITIDRAFKTPPSTENEYVIYDENYLYILSESDEISDGDILIDNDLSYKYWWLIVLLPNEVQFIKTVPFLEITQIESEV